MKFYALWASLVVAGCGTKQQAGSAQTRNVSAAKTDHWVDPDIRSFLWELSIDDQESTIPDQYTYCAYRADITEGHAFFKKRRSQ